MKGKGRRQNGPLEKGDQIKPLANPADPRMPARRFLDYLKREFPGRSKIQLLPVARRRGGRVAAEMLVEDIERNQSGRLSVADIAYLQQFKKELQEMKD